MVVVAIAGGNGGIGRALVETLQQSPRHEIVVLARKVRYSAATKRLQGTTAI
jgi:nucleoside-diphosphate-sugar epimerase